jgi:hypothetical protein
MCGVGCGGRFWKLLEETITRRRKGLAVITDEPEGSRFSGDN